MLYVPELDLLHDLQHIISSPDNPGYRYHPDAQLLPVWYVPAGMQNSNQSQSRMVHHSHIKESGIVLPVPGYKSFLSKLQSEFCF